MFEVCVLPEFLVNPPIALNLTERFSNCPNLCKKPDLLDLAENSIFNVMQSVNVITKSCFDPPGSLATMDVAASNQACN